MLFALCSHLRGEKSKCDSPAGPDEIPNGRGGGHAPACPGPEGPRAYLGGTSGGAWSVNVGYGRERIANAVRNQPVRLPHFADSAGSVPGTRFAERLIDKMPALSRVFGGKARPRPGGPGRVSVTKRPGADVVAMRLRGPVTEVGLPLKAPSDHHDVQRRKAVEADRGIA
jgi:hypothetical protein